LIFTNKGLSFKHYLHNIRNIIINTIKCFKSHPADKCQKQLIKFQCKIQFNTKYKLISLTCYYDTVLIVYTGKQIGTHT